MGKGDGGENMAGGKTTQYFSHAKNGNWARALEAPVLIMVQGL